MSNPLFFFEQPVNSVVVHSDNLVIEKKKKSITQSKLGFTFCSFIFILKLSPCN